MVLILPVHVIEVIFSKLPIYNLPICRLVCRAWNDLVSNFESLISNRILLFTSKFNNDLILPGCYCIDTDTLSSVASFEIEIGDFNPILFHSSCNGLLFVIKIDQFGVLNPMTNQFFEVPRIKSKVERIEGFGFGFDGFGFGFSPKTKIYKLFRVSIDLGTRRRRMEVFRFGTRNYQWSLIHGDLPFAIQGKGAYLNGVVYWIASKGEGRDECIVYAVDVETEKIESSVVLKLGCVHCLPISMKIQPFNGTVYAVFCTFKLRLTIQVWRMQGKDSWIRDFLFDDKQRAGSIPRSFYQMGSSRRLLGSFHLIKAFEDGGILVLIKNVYYCLDRMGRLWKMKTLDLINDTLVEDICHISSFNFGSVPNILGEHV